ncbi:MAG: hypothetical protein ACHQUA_00405 [Microgenomates group bacterium]
MAERRKKNPPDSFTLFRVVSSADTFVPWEHWKINVVHVYPNTAIPSDVEEHLQEWYTLRNRALTGQINADQFRKLQEQFSEEHATLFDSSHNIEAIRKISEKFPLAV